MGGAAIHAEGAQVSLCRKEQGDSVALAKGEI